MFGLNWIDGVIILLLLGAILAGLRVGLLLQLCVLTGFFGGLLLGGWLFPHLLPIHDRTLLSIVNGNLVLMFAAYLGVRGFDIGSHLHLSLARGRLHRLELGLGVFVSLAAGLVLIWLIAAAIGRLPFEGFSNSANDSLIVETLDSHLPAVPSVLGTFDRLVNPNNPAHIVLQAQPQTATMIVPSSLKTATVNAGAATVRITSFGCGGVIAGSGFVVAPDLIATAAHVIAGVQRPIIKDHGRSYAAVPVLFDPNLDFAVLRVSGFNSKPLTLVNGDVSSGVAVSIIGYPNGNYRSINGQIRIDLQIFGRNIYDVGVFGRDVYEIQAAVQPGDSGGPVVLSNGQVVGLVFARSDTVASDGYALTSTSLLGELQRAKTAYRKVNTGVCLAS